MTSPPLGEQRTGFADNPDHRTGSQKEATSSDLARWRHYNRVGLLPSTQTHSDPVQEAVLRHLMNGHRKLKVTTTDENGMNTTVFFDEAASLELIDHMAEHMAVKETRSRKGFRASLKENAPTASKFGDQNAAGVHTENTI